MKIGVVTKSTKDFVEYVKKMPRGNTYIKIQTEDDMDGHTFDRVDYLFEWWKVFSNPDYIIDYLYEHTKTD